VSYDVYFVDLVVIGLVLCWPMFIIFSVGSSFDFFSIGQDIG